MVVADVDEWNRIKRMCCIRCSIGIYGTVGISMVGNDDGLVIGSQCGSNNILHARVNSLDCLFNSRIDASMTHHVAISEIDNNKIILVLLDGSNQFVLDLKCAHFRFQVIGGYLWRRHQNSILSIIWSLTATIKEECDMSIFFSLSGMQLFESLAADIFTKRILHILLREDDMHTLERCIIRSHAIVLQILDGMHTLFRHILLSEDCCHLLGTVITIIDEDNHISLFDGSVKSSVDNWLHKFIGILMVGSICIIALLHCLYHIGSFLSDTIHQLVISYLDTVPALVTVHGIESAYNGSYFSCTLGTMVLQLLDKSLSTLWVCITAIHKAMDESVVYSIFLSDITHLEQVVQ